MWHHLHIFTRFQIFTLSYFQVYHTSHIFTFQGYYTVMDFMCSTFHCDDVFCSSTPSKSQKGNETAPLMWTRPLIIHEFIDRRLINPICFFLKVFDHELWCKKFELRICLSSVLFTNSRVDWNLRKLWQKVCSRIQFCCSVVYRWQLRF